MGGSFLPVLDKFRTAHSSLCPTESEAFLINRVAERLLLTSQPVDLSVTVHDQSVVQDYCTIPLLLEKLACSSSRWRCSFCTLTLLRMAVIYYDSCFVRSLNFLV